MALTAAERLVVQALIISDVTPFLGGNIDAAISTRSSHTAAAVWAVATRNLTNPAAAQDLSNMQVDLRTGVGFRAVLTDIIIGYINNPNLATIADISTLTATEIAHLDVDISTRATPAQVLTQIQTEVGAYSGQANLTTLLAALGIPDVTGKPLYTCLVTDRWDSRLDGTRAVKIDNLDVAISTRSSHDAAAVWAVVTRALTDKAGFSISGTKTTLDALNDITAASVWAVATRNLTAQAWPFTNPGAPVAVGNIQTAAYTRLGAPVGASISVDIAANLTAINALNNITAASVWAVAVRNLTAQAWPFTNPAAAVDAANIRLDGLRNASNPAAETNLQNARVLAVPKATDESGSFTWVTATHGTNEGDISALFTTNLTGTTRRKYTVYLDLTGPAGDAAAWTSCLVRVKVKVDGTNYRSVDKKDLAKTDVAAAAEPGVNIDIPAVAQDVQITLQFDVALAVDKTIYYHDVKEVLE